MPNTIEDVMRLECEFKACHKVLTAIGDETSSVHSNSVTGNLLDFPVDNA